MIFITLSGTDGSGKSTQTALLRDSFVKSGKKVAYFHALEHSLIHKTWRVLRGRRDFKPGKEKAVTSASSFSIRLRKLTLAVDVIAFRMYKHILKGYGIDILLSDRYFFDSVVNIEYLSGSKAFRSLDRTIVRPDFAFLLDVSPEEITKRERIPEQGLEYTKKKRSLFLTDTERFNLIRIDADGSKNEVVSLIRKVIDT